MKRGRKLLRSAQTTRAVSGPRTENAPKGQQDLGWRHSGFTTHRGNRIARNGQEALAHLPDDPQTREQFAAAITMLREMDMTYWLEQAEAEMRGLA
jgi:hypothetical protein